jgi:hypothetical protein
MRPVDYSMDNHCYCSRKQSHPMPSVRHDRYNPMMHVYIVRPRNDKRGVDLISDALPFGRLWYGEPNAVVNAIGYAEHRSRSHDAPVSG